MIVGDRILRNYKVLKKLLKFSIRYNDAPKFRKFSLVNTYNQLLIKFIEEVSNVLTFGRRLDFSDLFESIFKKEHPFYEPYIYNKDKKELIIRFQWVMTAADFAIDEMEDYITLGKIDEEMRKIKKIFSPVLQMIEYKNFD